ncbi:hypothetical protein BCR33DRAFT_741734 [Rhizoclosmatium globosum]|uniref:Uncharacterized protein n=1 Tax=Rhizoclosmatium globosum TaxID=329046 RepID=A0A1Y2BVV1_9FUNG|nr:hypothetical protein BCR33DRAFT_741734 [Rhizoclosmatium globosum]|eukprot:ORY38225.1 hypothetical protein BCR33DRAFT_741734 [Rhizoclosmatium globosum]
MSDEHHQDKSRGFMGVDLTDGKWSTTEKLLAGAVAIGAGAFAVHEWREHKRFTADAGRPAYTSYPSPNGPSTGSSPAKHPSTKRRHLTRQGHAYISYGGDETQIKNQFEILCGNPNTVTVIPQSGALNLNGLTHQPLDAGHEKDGNRLFVAIADYQGTTQVGKCGPELAAGINFGYGGKEISLRDYRVVCIA